MPRFVLLYHQCPPESRTPSHWDLMLEVDGALATWRLPSLPPAWQDGGHDGGHQQTASSAIAAVRLPDHRLAYLDYEGPVSGNRGTVCQVDGGEYQWRARTPTACEVEVQGRRIRGVLSLGQQPDGGWLLLFEPAGE